MAYNAADPKQVERQRQLGKLKEENQQEDLRKVLSMPEGRRLIWRYLEFCGVFKTSFHPSGSQVYFNEGQRNVGLMIIDEVQEIDPELFLLMTKENKGVI